MAATTVWLSMALPSRRTPMRASVRSPGWCCPSAPASGRIRGGQSSKKWSNPFPQDHKGRLFELCPPRILPEASAEGQHQPGERTEARMGVHLVRQFRTGPKTIWQSGLIRSHKTIKVASSNSAHHESSQGPVGYRESSQRPGLRGNIQPWDGRKPAWGYAC